MVSPRINSPATLGRSGMAGSHCMCSAAYTCKLMNADEWNPRRRFHARFEHLAFAKPKTELPVQQSHRQYAGWGASKLQFAHASAPQYLCQTDP